MLLRFTSISNKTRQIHGFTIKILLFTARFSLIISTFSHQSHRKIAQRRSVVRGNIRNGECQGCEDSASASNLSASESGLNRQSEVLHHVSYNMIENLAFH